MHRLRSSCPAFPHNKLIFPRTVSGRCGVLRGAFQFSGEDVDKKIRALSGGETSRRAIARMLYNLPNFLVLDEPTNHLDLATKEMLVDALKDFEGTMIFVSLACERHSQRGGHYHDCSGSRTLLNLFFS
jgi:ABC-type sugar transport system ATPase subunit